MTDKIGFTGTKNGMSIYQKASLVYLLTTLVNEVSSGGELEFHHGGCIGSDSEADKIVKKHFKIFEIHIHPANNVPDKVIAPCVNWRTTRVIYAPKNTMDRNWDIAGCGVLFATPKEDHEVLRSGTWATVRRGIYKKSNVFIIKPNGCIYIFIKKEILKWPLQIL